jgi:hypothetical protein
MRRRFSVVVAVLVVVLAPALASAQISFPKSDAYIAMGDSVAAGAGALPITNGYAYQLYDHGVFGQKTDVAFSNIALRGARSWDLRDHQVPQVLCAEPVQRPTIVTVTAGAGDFLRNDPDIAAIGRRVAEAIDLLLNNGNGLVGTPVLDPVTSTPCRALENVTILVSNYYSIPHPDPAVAALLDGALQGFDQALRFWLQFVPVPPGSTVAVVDLYTPSLGRQGLVLVERRLGISGPLNFDIHPTNLGHTFIARQFEDTWKGLQN